MAEKPNLHDVALHTALKLENLAHEQRLNTFDLPEWHIATVEGLATDLKAASAPVEVNIPSGVFADCACGEDVYYASSTVNDKYCPNCGAKLKWREDADNQ